MSRYKVASLNYMMVTPTFIIILLLSIRVAPILSKHRH